VYGGCGRPRRRPPSTRGTQPELDAFFIGANWRNRMTEWHKPEVTEQEVGLEVTSYLPAELDS
jgi:coenzyme PQQ precursor peptide PqqA